MTRCGLTLLCSLMAVSALPAVESKSPSYADVIRSVQPRMVKVFGSGGLRSLETYQSGFLISADGHVLTAWSYVLDTGEATIMLDDGRRFEGKLLSADPRTEIAILKIDATGLPFFDLAKASSLRTGRRVLAFSNLYGVATGSEPTSVQHGVVSGVTNLAARRGSFETPYRGTVYVLDAMSNNAGAAGGALTDSRGRLSGILGKELRDAKTNTWLNYAVPISAIRPVVTALLAGKPPTFEDDELPEESANLERLGILLIPNVLRNTPPFIDALVPDTPGALSALKPDDLIVLVNGQTVQTQAALLEMLRRIDAVDAVRLTVVRDTDLVDVTLKPILARAPETK